MVAVVQDPITLWRERYLSAPLYMAKSAGRTIPLRNAKADRWVGRYSIAMRRALKSLWREADSRVKRGLPPIPPDALSRWHDALYLVQRDFVLLMAMDGWMLTEQELGQYKPRKEPERKAVSLARVKVGGGPGKRREGLLVKVVQPSVEDWLREVSAGQTRTQAKKIAALHERAAREGLAPPEIAERLLKQGLAGTEPQAEMIARTNTIWAYNEGALLKYQDAGVAVVEWLATEDDLTCAFCMKMDGKRVRPGDPFLIAGANFGVKKRGKTSVMKAPRVAHVNHPPLHPHCRCVIVPVFEESEQ